MQPQFLTQEPSTSHLAGSLSRSQYPNPTLHISMSAVGLDDFYNDVDQGEFFTWTDTPHLSPASSPSHSSLDPAFPSTPESIDGAHYQDQDQPSGYRYSLQAQGHPLDSSPNSFQPGALHSFGDESLYTGYILPHSACQDAPDLSPQFTSPRTLVRSFELRQDLNNSDIANEYLYGQSSHGSPLQVKDELSSENSDEGWIDYHTSSARSSTSPKSKRKNVVATTKILVASQQRRIHPANVKCKECGNNFTTAFARDRHTVSHSGIRNFPCTKPGCRQCFSTDSGRKRHEKSPTLHK